MPQIHNSDTTFRSQTQHIDKDYDDFSIQIKPQWEQYFNEYAPPKKGKYIQYLPIYGLGKFYHKQEGQAPTYDGLSEGIPFFASFSTFALACQITKEARLEDPINLYAKVPKALKQSANYTMDTIVAGMYNYAFGGGRLLPDGQPLISGSHLLAPEASENGFRSRTGLTYSNSLGNAQLTVENLNQGQALMENLINARGIATRRSLTRLVIPSNPVLMQIAQEVLGTPTAPHENSRTVNTQHNGFRLEVNRYLTNPNAWLLQGENGDPGEDCHALTVWVRWRDGGKLGLVVTRDPITQNDIVIASFRIAYGAWDWPGIVGSLGGGPVVG